MKTLLLITFAILFPAFAHAGDYTIVPGDKLAILVDGEPDLSIPGAIVRPDGKISAPRIGEIQASGLTPTQLATTLTEKFKILVRKPDVNVTVLEGGNDKVYVIGSGVKAGVYELARFKNLLQVLASIEDLSLADLDQATLVRDHKVVVKGFRPLFLDGDVSCNQELKPEDVIVLPVLKDRYVYVSGAVNKPGSFPFHEGMTVLDALMAADGFNKFASKNSTKIVRSSDGKEEVVPVKGKLLLEKGDASQNVLLRRGDMVIVDEGFF